jgi:hypothetical protein
VFVLLFVFFSGEVLPNGEFLFQNGEKYVFLGFLSHQLFKIKITRLYIKLHLVVKNVDGCFNFVNFQKN